MKLQQPIFIGTCTPRINLPNKVDQITCTFNQLFAESYRTRLKGGAPEPYYCVCREQHRFDLHFREDFAASALHEIAHWCIAGRSRRNLDDFGYWYSSHRDEAAQQAFEQVEVHPQALEWILSIAARTPFRVSSDNLVLKDHDTHHFKLSVQNHVMVILARGLPPRATQFARQIGGDLKYLNPDNYRRLPD